MINNNQLLFDDESFEVIQKIITPNENMQDYTGKSIANRNDSYKKTQKNISKQCLEIIKAIGDNYGVGDAWGIWKKIGNNAASKLQTIRARCSDMSNADIYDPPILIDTGSVWIAETNRNVTLYSLTKTGNEIYNSMN